MCVWHDKGNVFLLKQKIAQECSAPASITQHHIYIRQVDTPTWCLFYFTGLALCSGITLAMSLDLSPTQVSPLANLLVSPLSPLSGR
jgi:hypothetical protein